MGAYSLVTTHSLMRAPFSTVGSFLLKLSYYKNVHTVYAQCATHDSYLRGHLDTSSSNLKISTHV